MSKFDLNKKDVDIQVLAEKAVFDKALFSQLMEGILSKDDVIRFNSFETLKKVSTEKPAFLYGEWDYFQEMLFSKNNYSKMIAVYILANLTAVDDEDKFEDIFDDYFELLGGTRAMISSHVALNSAVIFKNKVELQSRILGMLLHIDDIHEGKQIELIKSYVIEALQEIYPDLKDKSEVVTFVEKQTDSKSPKTRKKAIEFLNNLQIQ